MLNSSDNIKEQIVNRIANQFEIKRTLEDQHMKGYYKGVQDAINFIQSEELKYEDRNFTGKDYTAVLKDKDFLEVDFTVQKDDGTLQEISISLQNIFDNFVQTLDSKATIYENVIDNVKVRLEKDKTENINIYFNSEKDNDLFDVQQADMRILIKSYINEIRDVRSKLHKNGGPNRLDGFVGIKKEVKKYKIKDEEKVNGTK